MWAWHSPPRSTHQHAPSLRGRFPRMRLHGVVTHVGESRRDSTRESEHVTEYIDPGACQRTGLVPDRPAGRALFGANPTAAARARLLGLEARPVVRLRAPYSASRLRSETASLLTERMAASHSEIHSIISRSVKTAGTTAKPRVTIAVMNGARGMWGGTCAFMLVVFPGQRSVGMDE